MLFLATGSKIRVRYARNHSTGSIALQDTTNAIHRYRDPRSAWGTLKVISPTAEYSKIPEIHSIRRESEKRTGTDGHEVFHPYILSTVKILVR